ncbi:MAG: hypothetical protein M1812_006018 [Candelaria pacifica]|nr:MAG: hypothetical protein M1812_006018 [Candelaria pacifica]
MSNPQDVIAGPTTTIRRLELLNSISRSQGVSYASDGVAAISPTITESNEDVVALFVGPEKKLFLAAKQLLVEHDFFKAALKPNFMEALHNEINLPEEDPSIFGHVIQFMKSGEFFPRKIELPTECILSRRPMFQDQYPNTRCDGGGHYSSKCEKLEVELDVNERGRLKDDHYKHHEQRLGMWNTTFATHILFCQMIDLYCVADKYQLLKLGDLCYDKIRLFPIGPKELAILAENILTRVANNDDPIHWLLNEALEYHRTPFEERDLSPVTRYERWVNQEGKSQGWSSSWGPPRDPYADLETFFTREMSLPAQSLYRNLTQLRSSVNQAPRWGYGQGWSCEDERRGMIFQSWTAKDAFAAYVHYAKKNNIFIAQCEEESVANSDNCFPKFEFCEARSGDLITKIYMDKPVKGFVYGYNNRCDKWGFYPRKLVEFFEKRSRKNCHCEPCEGYSIRMQDGPRFTPHDPNQTGRQNPRGRRSRKGGKGARCSNSALKDIRFLFNDNDHRTFRAAWHGQNESDPANGS